MSSTHRVSLNTTEDSGAVTSLLNPIANQAGWVVRLGQYLDSIASGIKSGKVRLNVGAVQATGTITFSSFADADYITVNGVVLTAKTNPSGASQWAVGATDQACANNLVAKINASALDLIVGCVSASRRATVALSSFVATNTVTINTVVFTGSATPDPGVPEQFAIGSTDTITGKNLVAAIRRSLRSELDGITATESSGTVTLNFPGSLTAAISANGTATSTTVVLTCPIPGQIGNLCTLAISARGSVSAANFSGGTEGTETLFSRNNSGI